MSIDEISREIAQNAQALIGLDWQTFDTTALLIFRRGERTLRCRLDGVHLFLTRQSLLRSGRFRPPHPDALEDWFVFHFEILQESPFLQRYLDDHLSLASTIIPRSTNRADFCSSQYVRPVHVSLVAGGGHLDVICESVSLER